MCMNVYIELINDTISDKYVVVTYPGFKIRTIFITSYLNSQKCIIYLFSFSIFICILTMIFFKVPLHNVRIKILIIVNE